MFYVFFEICFMIIKPVCVFQEKDLQESLSLSDSTFKWNYIIILPIFHTGRIIKKNLSSPKREVNFPKR